ncbi:ABC transporter permease [Planctomycetota bacterium]
MLKLFLCLRYLRKRKIVFLSIIAVALSVALLIVVSSLFNSFIDVFEQSAVETIGDVVVVPPIRFSGYKAFTERLQQRTPVEAATAILSANGLLHLGKGNVRPVRIWGIEPAGRARVTAFKDYLLRQKSSLREPSFELPDSDEAAGIFAGIGVLAEPDDKTDEYDFEAVKKMIGTKVVLTTGTLSQIQYDDNEGPKIRTRTLPFSIADIVFTGVYHLDKFVYMPIEKLQALSYPGRKEPIAEEIQIKLSDDAQMQAALAQIRGLWADFAEKQLGWDDGLIRQTTITTAKELQSMYVAEFRKQMGILLLIFGVISLSTVVLIFCIFYMIVETRQRDIAIVKSCGATNNSVAFVFVGLGGCVGLTGSALGMTLGYIVISNINTIEEWLSVVFGLKLWKSSVYMFSRIPNQLDWSSAMTIVFFAVLAAAVGALIPAVIAAKTNPVDILRYE